MTESLPTTSTLPLNTPAMYRSLAPRGTGLSHNRAPSFRLRHSIAPLSWAVKTTRPLTIAGADVYQWSWVRFVPIRPSLKRRMPPIRMSMFGSPAAALADLYENAHARLWVNTSTAITAPALVGQMSRPSLYAR